MNTRALLLGFAFGGVVAVAALGWLAYATGHPSTDTLASYHCAAALTAAERTGAVSGAASIAVYPADNPKRGKCGVNDDGTVYQLTYDRLCDATEPGCTRLLSVVSESGTVTYRADTP